MMFTDSKKMKFVLVPVEPTEAMLVAGDDVILGNKKSQYVPTFDVYRAMLAASHQPQPNKPLFAEMISRHEGLREELTDMDESQTKPCALCGSDSPFSGTCGGGRENPVALCYQGPQPVQAQPSDAGGFGQKLFHEVSAFCPKLFSQATGFDAQPKPANQQKD